MMCRFHGIPWKHDITLQFILGVLHMNYTFYIPKPRYGVHSKVVQNPNLNGDSHCTRPNLNHDNSIGFGMPVIRRSRYSIQK